MLRRPTASIAFAILAWLTPLAAQTTNTFPTTGNVGIGTTIPDAPLSFVPGPGQKVQWYQTGNNYKFGVHIAPVGGGFFTTQFSAPSAYNAIPLFQFGSMSITDGTTYTPFLTVHGSGNVGIGTMGPTGKLHIAQSAGVAAISQAYAVANFENNYSVGGNALITLTGSYDGIIAAMNSAQAAVPMRFCTGTAERMRIDSGGNVGIGTTSPSHKLSVNGPIRAKEVIVDTGWSDCVFRPGYRLRPLSEVASYIQQHQHLPEIPPEQEVKEKGVSVGEMQAKLLAKIEELTLHMIQEHERNDQLEARNNSLEEQNRKLEGRVAALEVSRGSLMRREQP